MPTAEELRWIKATANELNNLLHLISDSGKALERFLPRHEEAEKYLSILRNSTERAVRVSESIAARAEGDPSEPIPIAIPAETTIPAAKPRLPTALRGGEATPVEIHNPGGTRE